MRLLQWFFDDPPASPGRAALVRRTLAFFGLALVAATWRLWTPQQVFPQVPFFHSLVALPAWCDWLGVGGGLVGLLGALFAPAHGRSARVALLTFATSMTLMCLADQERLQPWAYQSIIVALVLACAEPRAAVALLRLVFVSFYFYSALSKFDYAFLHTLGQQFLSALTVPLGASPDAWNPPERLAGALLFPMAELLIAAGLCFARTRRAALVAAVWMHVLLVVILGPAGLGHKPGMLVWNVACIAEVVLLFGNAIARRATLPGEASSSLGPLEAPRFVQALVLAVIVLPVLEPTTWFDIWPSWGLYAPRAERVTLLVHRGGLAQLPAELQAFAETPPDAIDPWLTLRLDRWSLAVLGAPIYPQNRYQLGVAEAVIARYRLAHRARVVRWSLAGRMTGKRDAEVLAGLPQVEAAASDYLLNTRPRQGRFSPPDATP